MSSATKEQKHAQALCGSEKGRAYAGDDHEAEHPALRHDIHGMYRRSGDAGNKPMLYLYIGAAVPVVLLLLRQALDFSYKEELVMASLADYVEQVRTWVEEVPVAEKPDPVLQEEIVDKITRSIRQTAATGSHFSKMLSPEEEEIMREIIREFMNAE